MQAASFNLFILPYAVQSACYHPSNHQENCECPFSHKKIRPSDETKGKSESSWPQSYIPAVLHFLFFFFPFKSWPAVFINDVNTETTGTSHADQTQTLRKLAQLSYCRPSGTSSTSQLCLPSGEKRGDSWAAFSSPHPQARRGKHSIQELCMVLLWQKANTVCFANWALCVVERNESSPARAFHIF